MKIRKSLIGGVVIMLLMALVVGCHTPGGRSAGTVIDDSTITTKVKTKLFDDDQLSGFSIDVETFQGEVTLIGGVDSERLKERAGKVAESVTGVKSVNNLLKVK